MDLYSSSGAAPDRDHTVAEQGRENGRNLSEDVLRLVVEGLTDHAVVTLDPHGVITFWNAGAEHLFGWRSEQAVRVHVSSLLGPGGQDAGIGTTDLEEAKRQGSVTAHTAVEPSGRQHQRRQNDHSRASKHDRCARVRCRGASVPWHRFPPHSGLAEHAAADTASTAETRRQLSESRALLAAEIADRTQAETSRARLLRRLVVAQEDERRRLAQDLHDGLGQRLTALRLMLEALDGDRSAQPAGAASALEMLACINQDVDFIAWELRPAALDELGLARVLETYVKEWSRHAGVPAVFHARPGNLQRFAPEVEASIYRIAQEALNNVAKHARARSANVLLELRDENLALVVEDDGVGFQPTAKGETMLGLTGMRERALAVGGTVELEPTPGGGTTVLACIPTTGGCREHSRTAGDAGDVTDPDSRAR